MVAELGVPGLMAAYRAGRVTVANAIGTVMPIREMKWKFRWMIPVLPSMFWGGIATVTEEMARAAASLGAAVDVWAPAAPPGATEPAWPFAVRTPIT